MTGMTTATGHHFDTDNIRQLLLDMPQERTVQGVLDLIVRRLSQQANVALARIWLKKPGDICEDCRMRPECPDQTECLHLVASAGRSLDDEVGWNSLNGAFRRFPVGVRKVGHIAATRAPVEIEDVREDNTWIARPDWIEAEQIRGFGGQPLLYKEELLGVLSVFARRLMVHDNLIWLRMIANHAATAITNARAFEEIERLQRRLELENEYLREEIRVAHGFSEIIGQSDPLKNVLTQIELVAPAETNVLICGESGTGKELVARAIHERSRRSHRPLVSVNCASIPRELFESEFFGHSRGAFTGAIRDRVGRFHLADGGTIFLDEVGEIPIELQSKLLRVLQEGTFERIGEEQTRRVDVRVIAATNRDLKQDAGEGGVREDLYYRLAVFLIEIAPLRDRVEDIPLLAAGFLEEASRRLGLPELKLKQKHVEALHAYSWPGNVRELQNVIERAVITAQTGALEFTFPGSDASEKAPQASAQTGDEPAILTYDELQRRERANILVALEATHWRISGPRGAARLLGLKPTTLTSKIKAMKLNEPKERRG